VRNKAIYIALGILPEGTKEILGIWIEQTEGGLSEFLCVRRLSVMPARSAL
jgi:transposase-like protein